MDLIDEQHIARLQVGQLRGQIRGTLEHRPRGLAQIHTQLDRNDIGQRGLAQTRWPEYQHMIHGLGALACRGDEDLHLPLHMFLSHIVRQALRTNGTVLLLLTGLCSRAGHAGWFQCASFSYSRIAPCSASRMSSSVECVPASMPLSKRVASAGLYCRATSASKASPCGSLPADLPANPGTAGWVFTRSRISMISRSAVLRPTPGMRVSIVASSPSTQRVKPSTLMPDSTPSAIFGPTPETLSRLRNRRRSASVAKP